MFLPEMYFRHENYNSFAGRARFVENHDSSQSRYPSKVGKVRDAGRSSLYSATPSSHTTRQPHVLIDDNICEGDSDPCSYAHPLNGRNVISNSLSVNQQTSFGENENDSIELNPPAFIKEWNLRKQDDQSDLNPDEGNHTFLLHQEFVGVKAPSLTARNQKGKRKPRKAAMAPNNPVERTGRELNPSLLSRPSGSKDRHTMVLTSKGARDRRMRLSVGTAIKLYCVQDMLGFEQPSQAVEWLLEKSQAAIRELPQLASISSPHISNYVDSIRANASVSCPQTGDLSTSSQDNVSTANGDCLVNLYQPILATKTCIGQTSSTGTTTESSNKGSIAQGEKEEQRSLAVRSVASNPRTRETVHPKEFRAKARERARERTRQKDQSYSQQSGICGILQLSSVSPQTPTFFLQDNTSSASSLNMVHETTVGNSKSNTFLHSLMSTKDSILDCQSRVRISPPPDEIQCSLAGIHYYNPQQDGSSFQSTEALCGLDSEIFHLPSDPFPQALATTHPSSSQGVFCTYPLDHAHLQSCNLCRCCTRHSIEMPCIYDGALETLCGQSSADSVFPEFEVSSHQFKNSM